MEKSLPAEAEMVFPPASFSVEEDWPMLQRAYFAAQSIGIAERTHQRMFDAVWKTGELGISGPVTHQLKNPHPTLEDATRCYGRLDKSLELPASSSMAIIGWSWIHCIVPMNWSISSPSSWTRKAGIRDSAMRLDLPGSTPAARQGLRR